MIKRILVVFFSAFLAINLACQSATEPNANTSVDESNLPEGISTKPLNVNGELPPGIPNPANANLPKGATPTPGIPDPKTIGKTPMPKNTPPIPGIPDEETLKKQMNQMRNNSNATIPLNKNQSDSKSDTNTPPRVSRKPAQNNKF